MLRSSRQLSIAAAETETTAAAVARTEQASILARMAVPLAGTVASGRLNILVYSRPHRAQRMNQYLLFSHSQSLHVSAIKTFFESDDLEGQLRV